MSTKAELFPGESRGSFTNHNTGTYLLHGINITTNQRLSPTFRGNGNTIIAGDSQTSPLPIFPEGGGTSVHRLPSTWVTEAIGLVSNECKLFNEHKINLKRSAWGGVDTFVDLWYLVRQTQFQFPISAAI